MRGIWLRKANTNAVVIFVHGILSSAEECWKNPNGSYWPQLLAEDSRYDGIGIYLFTYSTGVFSGSYDLSDVVDALKEQLKLDDVLPKGGNAIFVCHSMGGIVARKFVVDQQLDIFSLDIRIGLFLVASPSLGSEYANWLSPFSKNYQLEALKFSEQNSWLKDLDKTFKNLREENKYFDVSGKELIEDKALLITRLLGFKEPIVSKISGTRYFGDQIKIPNTDHSSIAKPRNSNDLQHRLLCGFISDETLKPAKLRNIVVFHGTKYNVPGGNDWWNSLMLRARSRFYIVGESNKSWINKDEGQKILLAESIIRILSNGGEVKIMSTSEEIVPVTVSFLNNYVLEKANSRQINLEKILGKSLVYAVTKHINYNAVVSDDKLIIMPTLNTRMFRNDCMVLEIEQKSLKSTFNNYIADIERLFASEDTKKIIFTAKMA